MHIYIYVSCMCIWCVCQQVMKSEATNLKENKEGHMKGFGGRKG